MNRAPWAVNNFKSITINGTGRIHLGNRILLEDEDESKEKCAIAAAEWFSPSNHHQRRINLFSKRHGRTGEWLLHTPEFHKWVNEEDQTLWCYGIAGCGKSVIASLIADRLIQYKQDSTTYVAFIFANSDLDRPSTAEDVIKGLLKQFLIEHELDTYCLNLENMYAAHCKRKTCPSWEECLDVFRLSMEKASRVYIVIDGLDQLGIDDESMTKLLGALEGWTNLNLLITARSKTPFRDWKRPRVYFNVSAKQQDMKEYLEHRILMVPGFQTLLARDASLQDHLVKTIVNRSQGIFLIVKRHFDFIATRHCVRHIQAALQTSPKLIDDVYQDSWLKIHEQHPDTVYLATQVLDFVCYAFEPLRTSELQCVLSRSGINAHYPYDMIDGDLLISICGGLVFVAPDETVRFIHPTAHRFYEELRAYNPKALLFRLRLLLFWALEFPVSRELAHSLDLRPLHTDFKKRTVSAFGFVSKRSGWNNKFWMSPRISSLQQVIPLLGFLVLIVYIII